MPIEQICTIVSAEKLNEFAWSFTLEAGDLVKREGLRAGQFLHVKCGAEHLLGVPGPGGRAGGSGAHRL